MKIGDKVILSPRGRDCQAFSIKRYGEPGVGEIVRFTGEGNPVVKFENRKCTASFASVFLQTND